MIEVEKKFQPTEKQLQALLREAEFLGEKENVDTYYDLPGFVYAKATPEMKLRKRNGSYELKIKILKNAKDGTELNEELETDEEILERLGFPKNDNLEKLVQEKMEILCSIKTKRRKYKLREFCIDVDETDYGYNMCEIELGVEEESQIEEAEKKILDLATSFGFSLKKCPGKISECLRITRPEVYKELYGNKI